MIIDRALVIYKNKLAIAKQDGDKLELAFLKEPSIRVREKDIEVLHEGPIQKIPEAPLGGEFETAWEITNGSTISLKELAELAYGAAGPAELLGAWAKCQEGLLFRFFEGNAIVLTPKDRKDEEEKKSKKLAEVKERMLFIERAKKAAFATGDERFYGELEALAYGKTIKSKTAQELGIKEDPEAVHSWLLKTGLWTNRINPFPIRLDYPMKAPKISLGLDNDKDRVDIGNLEAWAIDSPWSHDPDDALSWDGEAIWIHVADPASIITPDSLADKEAAIRSGTLYIPETTIPMLPSECLKRFSLGLSEGSRALSFRIKMDNIGLITEVELFYSFIKVKRCSYEEADGLIENGKLSELYEIANIRKNYRKKNGSVDINIPEIRIWVDDGECHISSVNSYHSEDLVKELMVLTGEAAARWAFERKIPFPYYSQEAPGQQNELPSGLAGEFAKRRLMKAGMAGVQPRAHQGLGVSMYTQVTSPLRRYTDLLAHQQIRAWLAEQSGQDKNLLLDNDELSMKLAKAAAGTMALRKAERQSELHWTLVWLQDRPGWEGEGIAVQSSLGETVFFVPSLGLEAKIRTGKIELNSKVDLRFLRADIPKQEVFFTIL